MSRITKDEAIKLNQNFIKTKGKALDKIVEKEEGHPNEKDAISSWFSLAEIKEYIEYIEAQGKAQEIDINGIRIYFGSYAVDDKKKTKKGLSTVFLVPTTPKVGAKQKGGDAEGDGSDVTKIDGLNEGGVGYPPSAKYPQL